MPTATLRIARASLATVLTPLARLASLTAIALSLLALTSLTQKRWPFGIAMIPTVLGVVMGLAGLAGWHRHPAAVTQMLS